jgi:hypothetical protein
MRGSTSVQHAILSDEPPDALDPSSIRESGPSHPELCQKIPGIVGGNSKPCDAILLQHVFDAHPVGRREIRLTVVVCLSCGRENLAYRFCLACGADLPAPTSVDARPGAVLPDDLRGVRVKQVSLGDLIGCDAISEYYTAQHLVLQKNTSRVLRVLTRDAALQPGLRDGFSAAASALLASPHPRMQITDFFDIDASPRTAMLLDVDGGQPSLADLLAFVGSV